MFRKFINSIKNTTKQATTNERGSALTGVLITIAVTLIISAFILRPGARNFATTVLNALTNWWSNTIAPSVFPSS
jgi:hypothetical protein